MENARLLRMREKLVIYNFAVKWTPGKSNTIADALSRAPIFDPEVEELTTSTTIQCLTNSEKMRQLTTHKCENYNLLKAYIQNSNQQNESDITAPYKKI